MNQAYQNLSQVARTAPTDEYVLFSLNKPNKLSLVSSSGDEMYFNFYPCFRAFVSTSEGLKAIPSPGIPQELLDSPYPDLLLKASSIQLLPFPSQSKSREFLRLRLQPKLLGGSRQIELQKVSKTIAKDLINGQFENAMNLAQDLSAAPIQDIQNPSAIADTLLNGVYESLNSPKVFPVYPGLADSARLIILKMALHLYIGVLSRGERIQYKQYLPTVLLEKNENRLYIEVKFLKYLLNNQNNLKELLGIEGIEALKFVGSLGLSKVIGQLHQKHLNKGNHFYRSFNSKMLNCLLGRYLILSCLRQKRPKKFSFRMIAALKEYGWKTLYRILEVATTWCLKKHIPKDKIEGIVGNIFIPLAEFDSDRRYGWRVREKAIESLLIVNPRIGPTSLLRQIKWKEKDKRVLKTFQINVQARYDVGHVIQPYDELEISNKFDTNIKEIEDLIDSSEHFIGRETELKVLVSKIQRRGEAIGVIGSAGIGKTAFVMKSLRILKENNILNRTYEDGILFIQCRKIGQPSFYRLDCELKHLNKPISNGNRWGKYLKNAIVVIDSSDYLSKFKLREIISELNKLSVIITSRRRSDSLDMSKIELNTMELQESQNIFRSYFGYLSGIEMCSNLGGFPSAISDIAKFASERDKDDSNPDRQLMKYKQSKKWVKEYMNRNSRRLQTESIENGFKSTFRIRESLSVLSEKGMALLATLGCMAFDYFEKEYIAEDLREELNELLEFNFVIQDSNGYRITHILLYRYAFFNLKSPFFYTQLDFFIDLINNPVHARYLLRHALRIQERAFVEGYYQAVIDIAQVYCTRLLNDYLYSYSLLWLTKRALKVSNIIEDQRNRSLYNYILANVFYTIGKYPTAKKYLDIARNYNKHPRDLRLKGEILQLKGLSLFEAGKTKKSIALFYRALKIVSKTGTKDKEATVYYALGNVHFRLGNIPLSIDAIQKAVELAAHSENVELKALIYLKLANVFKIIGDISKTLDCCKCVLSFANQIRSPQIKGNIYLLLGIANSFFQQIPNSINCYEIALEYFKKSNNIVSKAQIYNSIGVAYYALGDYEKAIEYLENALFFIAKTYNNNERGNAYGNLGSTYLNIGKYDQALKYLKLSLNTFKETGDRRSAAIFANKLGNLYLKMRKTPKAMKLFHYALEISEETKNEFLRVACLCNLGEAYIEQRNPDQAEIYLHESLSSAKNIKDRKSMVLCYFNLARLKKMNSNIEEALKYYRNTYELSNAIEYKNGKYLSLYGLGEIYIETGQYTKAIDYFNRGCSAISNSDNLLNRAAFLNKLGFVHQIIGKINEAENYYSRALSILKGLKNKIDHVPIILNLARLYIEKGEIDQAKELLEEKDLISQNENHLERAINLNNLGEIHQKLGNTEKAADFYLQALAMIKQIQSRTDILTILGNLSNLYIESKQFEEARELIEDLLRISEEIDNKKYIIFANDRGGIIYNRMGNYKEAIHHFTKAYSLHKEFYGDNDPRIALDLGVSYLKNSQFDMSNDILLECLDAYERNQDQEGEISALLALGNLNLKMKNLPTAKNYIEIGLNNSIDIQNKDKEADFLQLRGCYHHYNNEFNKCIEYLNQALQIYREIKNNENELGLLLLLSKSYHGQLEFSKALEYSKNTIVLARRYKNKQHEGLAFAHMASSFFRLKDMKNALECINEAKTILIPILPAEHEHRVFLDDISSDIYKRIHN